MVSNEIRNLYYSTPNINKAIWPTSYEMKIKQNLTSIAEKNLIGSDSKN